MATVPGLASKFDEIPETYDRWRPDYPPALYADLLDYKSLGPFSRALEIGIGTGQATPPILRTGCRLTAAEAGSSLAAFTRRKFGEYRNFDVQNVKFEDLEAPDGLFDLIYSASAFHWIPEETGYPKVFRLLKSGGAFARFANVPAADPENEPLHAAIQRAYAKYMPGSSERPPYGEKDALRLAETAGKYGFADRVWRLYHRVRTFDAQGYVSLLATYSDHRALEKDRRDAFFEEIKDAIGRHGGVIRIYDTVDLELGRKP